ncbi:MAG TPA: Asp-tRNA(Asn)/Glu-tRNA(Gln) amidotransferase subunit GatC [Anaerolineaceae bacterium]|jgi:aspartyl/glutamyl-tRNA(Asn/Gln) amidotransferase C subunit|nr:Asp-tRNA(Asn)/Glu-tRNA(Gln) amidotransferase subunit GatC [Anaerolineaceae bacterium]
MSEEITPEVFDHLVQLAALALTPAEAEYLRGQLNNQLNSIHELAATPVDEALTITSHGVAYTPEISSTPRPDTWVPYPAPDDILAQAPQVEDRYIVVPEIPHTELE